MFGTLGGPELFLIMVVALIVFGPRKLPEIGKSVGKMMAEFRKASNDFKRTIEDEVEAEKLREATRIEAPSWSASEPALAALPTATVDPAGDSSVSVRSPVPRRHPARPYLRPRRAASPWPKPRPPPPKRPGTRRRRKHLLSKP